MYSIISIGCFYNEMGCGLTSVSLPPSIFYLFIFFFHFSYNFNYFHFWWTLTSNPLPIFLLHHIFMPFMDLHFLFLSNSFSFFLSFNIYIFWGVLYWTGTNWLLFHILFPAPLLIIKWDFRWIGDYWFLPYTMHVCTIGHRNSWYCTCSLLYR